MKKTEPQVSEMRSEYRREDLGRGTRGKHLAAYRSGTNLVLLQPDVARAFPTAEAVNEALRSLMELARRTRPVPERQKSITPGTPSTRRAQ